ncbi:TadE/TadG family type IV pilus assembly protein [Stappia stellulata]|uniref:TadE/TadG family type IV pilus assembly protein n=1 Tax=Stappia stellulata TaxID=71235 RepID=UPI0003F9296B|nr:TadE/TadG family type IV pilus assembly protein [Stappia stellulata]
MKKSLFRFSADRGGVAAVEFAIVLPVFLVLMLGILAYGIYFGATHSLAQLAADAARASVAGLSDAERQRIVAAHIASASGDYAMIDASKVVVEAGPMPGLGEHFRVVVRYDATDLPIWQLEPFLPLPGKTIERSAVVMRGGY